MKGLKNHFRIKDSAPNSRGSISDQTLSGTTLIKASLAPKQSPQCDREQADGTGQMWRDLHEGIPLCTWHSSPLRSLECDFPSPSPSVEPVSPSRRRWHALLTCHWFLERATCVQSPETSASIHDVRPENGRSKTRSQLQGLTVTKRLIWESGTVRGFVNRMTSSCSAGIYIFTVLRGLCCHTEPFVQGECLRVLLKGTWARKILKASVGFWMEDNL